MHWNEIFNLLRCKVERVLEAVSGFINPFSSSFEDKELYFLSFGVPAKDLIEADDIGRKAVAVPRRYFFCGSFMFLFCLVFAMSVRVCLYVLCGHLLGKGWPLGSRLWCLLWVCHFPIGILGQVWYLIVSIPDLCTFTYFHWLTFSWKSVFHNPLKFYKLIKFWGLRGQEEIFQFTNRNQPDESLKERVWAAWPSFYWT